MMMAGRFCRLALAAAVIGIAGGSLGGCATALVGATAAGAGMVVGSDSRTVDVMAEDEQVVRKAQDIIREYTGDSNAAKDRYNLHVISMSGNVLVVGQTRQQDELRQMLSRIKEIEGIRTVYNYVEDMDPVSAGTVAHDSFITSKIKTALLLGREISSGRFKIYTENSNVYMMGFVTRDEANRAVNEVRKISGVSRIITLFDYMNEVSPTSQVAVVDGDFSTPTGIGSGSAGTAEAAAAYGAPAHNSSSLAVETQATVDNGGASIVEDDGDLGMPGSAANW